MRGKNASHAANSSAIIFSENKTKPRTVKNYTFQPALRPELPCVYGPIDYRQQRELFKRIDQILSTSGLEDQFIELAIKDHRIDLKALGSTRF